MSRTPVLLVGLGNRWRGDDGVGPWLAQQVASLSIDGVESASGVSDSLDLIERWRDREAVYLVDALSGTGVPGTVHRIDALTTPLPSARRVSSHALDLAGTIALARTLDRLPCRLTLIGVEGRHFGHGAVLSAEVEASAAAQLAALEAELRRIGRT